MTEKYLYQRALSAVAGALLAVSTAQAQDPATVASAASLTQANNPLAAFNTLNLQDQYNGNLTGLDDWSNNVFLRGAFPVSTLGTDWLVRATLPVNRVPFPMDDHTVGVGDFNVFAAALIDTGIPDLSFGIGPQITVPSATRAETGSEKWSLGLANILFSARNPKLQWGYLLTWQASVAGDNDRDAVNAGAFQPLLIRQLGKGWYLRSTAIWTYDFESDNFNIPFGLGLGRAIRTDSAIVNIFAEPQVSLASRGDGQSEWGVFAGINFQFPR